MSVNEVKTVKGFWEKRALHSSVAKELVAHPDFNQRLLEIEVLLQHLPNNGRV